MSTSNTAPSGRTAVIGVGNALMSDDGLGLVALETLRAEWDVPATVELVDGGTWGLNLLPVIEAADQVLLIDAIDRGAVPGSLHVLERDHVPRYLSTKLSPHQVDLRDVFALAELRGTLPRELVALGLQPARIEMSCTLSDPVQARMGDLVVAVTRRLADWGHAPQPRATPAHA
ncbi:MAG TPA: HyaD/HybD family hydrogenase maturation endopeptidase [Gemmatimonadales bacterium]|nr:HyaD/HybD family hydrogenase maturation endopeptidase [Gemmatimonadales bacterium]